MENERYIVFDVETPNHLNDRMSAIGIHVIEGGRITRKFCSYVDPEQPFDRFNTLLTGISAETVRSAPTFPQVWEKIGPVMGSGILVAHNAAFDMGVLRCCLRDYGIRWQPRVNVLCTVIMGRKLLPGISHRLNDMCAYYGIPLDHHQADSDSCACARILLRYIASGADPAQFVKTYIMR